MSELEVLKKAAADFNWDVADLCSICGYNHHRFMDVNSVLEEIIEDRLISFVLDSLILD